jgi:hypothetical protein
MRADKLILLSKGFTDRCFLKFQNFFLADKKKDRSISPVCGSITNKNSHNKEKQIHIKGNELLEKKQKQTYNSNVPPMIPVSKRRSSQLSSRVMNFEEESFRSQNASRNFGRAL